MNDTPRSMHHPRRLKTMLWLACLLACIRLVAVGICSTCFLDFETPKTRAFYFHDGSDHDACHHGRAQGSPLLAWACAVTQDDSDFVLPAVPRLPVVLSFFLSFFLMVVSRRDHSLIAANGRAPPAIPVAP